MDKPKAKGIDVLILTYNRERDLSRNLDLLFSSILEVTKKRMVTCYLGISKSTITGKLCSWIFIIKKTSS